MASPRLALERRGPCDGTPVAGSALGKPLLWHTAAGTSSDLRPEVYRLDLEPGDALLLCTEGATRHVPNPALAHELAAPIPLGRRRPRSPS